MPLFLLRRPVGGTPASSPQPFHKFGSGGSIMMTSLPSLLPAGNPCPNLPDDVRAVHQCLMQIGKIPCYPFRGAIDDTIIRGIMAVQRHFMRNPDGVISVNGTTHNYLLNWKEKPIDAGVQLPGRLKEAWDWVNPLLPDGSHCTSGFRSADEQRRILHNFYSNKYRTQIIAKYGQQKYDTVKSDLSGNESDVLEMVRGVGQAIAAPGTSMHQKGKAVDIGGPDTIDAKQVEVVKLVARAHPDIFSGKVLKERNGCVHFEIV